MSSIHKASSAKGKIKVKTNAAIWDSLAVVRRKGKEKAKGREEKEKAEVVEVEVKEMETKMDEQAETEAEREKEDGETEMVQENEEVAQIEAPEVTQIEAPEVAQIEAEEIKQIEVEDVVQIEVVEVTQNEAEEVVQRDAGEGKQDEAAGEAEAKAEVEMLSKDAEHTADEDSMMVEPEETQDAAEDALPIILVRTNGQQKSKEIATASISSSMETRRRKVPMTNGHDDSLSVANRRSSRLKAPEHDLPQESVRRVTRYSSLASIPFIVGRIVLTTCNL